MLRHEIPEQFREEWNHYQEKLREARDFSIGDAIDFYLEQIADLEQRVREYLDAQSQAGLPIIDGSGVFALADTVRGLIRLGSTTDLRTRFNSLNAESPVDLILVRFQQLYSRREQRKRLDELKAEWVMYKVKGDWYAMESKGLGDW